MIHTHEYITKNPASMHFQVKIKHKLQKEKLYMSTRAITMARMAYHRGLRGGGTSKAMNPLMQTWAMPSPVFRTYWKQTSGFRNTKIKISNDIFRLPKQDYGNRTCSGVRLKGLSPMVNEMFGMVEMLLQSITDSPIGLGRLSHSC
jgi:hypothetical protein